MAFLSQIETPMLSLLYTWAGGSRRPRGWAEIAMVRGVFRSDQSHVCRLHGLVVPKMGVWRMGHNAVQLPHGASEGGDQLQLQVAGCVF